MIRLIVLLSLCLGLVACETAKGMGRDLGSAGNAIEGAATDVQQKF